MGALVKVWIAQLLCPLRHCILAVAGEYETEAAAGELSFLLGAHAAELMTPQGPFDHWCGICGSKELKIELAPSIFSTLDEARPILAQLQQEQIRNMAMLQAQRRRN